MSNDQSPTLDAADRSVPEPRPVAADAAVAGAPRADTAAPRADAGATAPVPIVLVGTSDDLLCVDDTCVPPADAR